MGCGVQDLIEISSFEELDDAQRSDAAKSAFTAQYFDLLDIAIALYRLLLHLRDQVIEINWTRNTRDYIQQREA